MERVKGIGRKKKVKKLTQIGGPSSTVIEGYRQKVVIRIQCNLK